MKGMFKAFYDISPTTLWSQEEGSDPSARFVLSFRDGRPRFVVYLGGEKGIINFPCDYSNMCAIIEATDMLISAEPGTKVMVSSITTKFENNERTNETFELSVVHVGKTKNGLLYISITSEGKASKVFPLINSKWHQFTNETKEPIEVARLTKFFARGWCNLIRGILANAATDYARDAYEHGEYKPYQIEDKKPGNFKDKKFTKGNYQNNQKQAAPKEGTKEYSFDSFNEDVTF